MNVYTGPHRYYCAPKRFPRSNSGEGGIDFILGYGLYMKAIHGAKTKNDRIDSLKIARLIIIRLDRQ